VSRLAARGGRVAGVTWRHRAQIRAEEDSRGSNRKAGEEKIRIEPVSSLGGGTVCNISRFVGVFWAIK
jgi:hypothetical protein